jgi:hypothetical protein
MTLSRRGFLRGLGAAAALTVVPGKTLRKAFAATAPVEVTGKAICIVYLPGGWHGRFLAADQYAAAGGAGLQFGATTANTVQVANTALHVDKDTFGSLPTTALANLGVVGINTSRSDHPGAQFKMGGVSYAAQTDTYARQLAAAMVGTFDATKHANACAILGVHNGLGGSNDKSIITTLPSGSPMPQLGIQQFSSVDNLTSSVVAANDPRAAQRALAAVNVTAAQGMSTEVLANNGNATQSLITAYQGAAVDLGKTATSLTTYASIAPAYSEINVATDATVAASTSGQITNFATKMAAAEFAIRNCGTKVAVVIDAVIDGRGNAQTLEWDTHEYVGGNGSSVSLQQNMVRRIIPAIKAFTTRMATSGIEVTLVLASEFVRGIDVGTDPTSTKNASDHGGAAIAAVLGPQFKAGTTAVLDTDARTSIASPSAYAQDWDPLYALLARSVGVSQNPWSVASGKQDHSSLLR